MKRKTQRTCCLLALSLFLGLANGYGQQIIQDRSGDQINGATLVVEDPYFYSTPIGTTVMNQKPVMDVVLEFTDNKNNFFPYDWSAQVSYTINLWKSNTGSPDSSASGMLTINYDRNNPFKDIDIKSYFNKFIRAQLTVTTIVFTKYLGGSPVNTASIPVNSDFLDWTDITLSLRYTPDHVYNKATVGPVFKPAHSPHTGYNPSVFDFCPILPPGGGWTKPANNEVTISWSTQPEAVSYDLEWVFIDIPEGQPFAAQYYFDWRNAVRINVTGTSAKIPLAYPRGKIIYRVRMISKWWHAAESKYYLEEGPWTRVGSYSPNPNLDVTTSSGTITNDYYFNYCGLEPGKNWSYAASFVESGKRTESLSFLDGTGRERKNVSFNYAENVTIINRTYYDKQGRPAVKILPTPVEYGGNSYYENFIDGFNNTQFDDATLLATGNAGLPAGHPTNTYYSTSNPFLASAGSGYNDKEKYGFIPISNNYGFVQIKYKNDGSGRVDATTMPGPMHKLGSGHETQNTYGSVGGQGELDRLFGNEIGFSEHYKKNKSIDPNGVTTISYVDGSGRVVATALAGGPALQNLNSITHTPEFITVSLQDNLQIANDGSIITTKELVVPVPGEYVFNYSLAGAAHDLGCFESKDCLYDVFFTVTGENGQAITLTNAVGGGAFPGSFLGVSSQSAFGFKANFTSPGKYTVTKITKLSQSVQNYYAELAHYLTLAGPGPGNPCLPQDMIESPCYDCERYCEEAYRYEMTQGGVTGTVWIMPSPAPNVAPIQYTDNQTLADLFPADITYDGGGTNISFIENLINACKNNCTDPNVVIQMSECDIMFQALLHDVSPGGQYFDNHPATLENTSATQSDKDRWLNLFVGESVRDALSGMAGLTDASWEELREVWTSEMSVLLLPFHPEYCQYDYFCNHVAGQNTDCCGDAPPNHHENSGAYDIQMHAGHDVAYATAPANTFFDPLALNTILSGSVPSYYEGPCENRDPYFCNNPDGELAMRGYLLNYIANPWDGGYYSIWDFLDNAASVHTANPLDPQEVAIKQYFDDMAARFALTPLDPLYATQHINKYQFFRAYYQGRKKQIIQSAFPAWAAEHCNSCTNFVANACVTCIDADIVPDEDCTDCWLSSLDSQSDGIVDDGHSVHGCYYGKQTLALGGFYIRYPYIYALQDPNDITQTDLCGTQCNAYAISWINQMTDEWMGCDSNLTYGFTQDMRDYLYTAFYNFCMGECTPLGNIGAVPDFNTPEAQVQLQDIVNDFQSNTGIINCPTHFFNSTITYGMDPPPTQNYSLPCECANIAELIMAAGANDPSYPNPLHFDKYGLGPDQVADLSLAVDWINDVLNQLGSASGPITVSDLGYWMQICSDNNSRTINEVAAVYGAAELPDELKCTVGGPAASPCENIIGPLDQIQNWAIFNQALAGFLVDYQNGLQTTCMNGLATREVFTVTYLQDEFHYTLYYYDRAGNLIKTVPPAGIKTLDASNTTAADTYRNSDYTAATYASSGSFKRPDHRLVTNYKYNSLDQVIEQTTPDAGTTKFWYDEFGRPVLSQNAKQLPGNKYSYSRYDDLGRIREVGEITCTVGCAVSVKNVADKEWLDNFFSVNAGGRSQITFTRYDVPLNTTTSLPAQNNIRNRVASSCYFETQPNGSLSNYVHATHYSYDVHGNVVQSIQDMPFLNQFGMRFAVTEYEYELVSGNMKKVSYRKGAVDQFYHRYSYDANNSLITVQSSRDGKIWETEAEYFYRHTGEIYREETGAKKVQGTDYASTIHGWHKAVNGTRMDPTVDMGRDGRHVLATHDNHNLVARDAFGYALTYYNGDYTKTGTSLASFEHANMFSSAMGTAIMGLNTSAHPRGQFNGNIAATVTTMRYDYPGVNPPFELGFVYTYDQLYRLNTSTSFAVAPGSAFSWTGVTSGTNWNTEYTYDANGNIKTLKRRDHQANMMDNLTYYYDTLNGRLKSNKLYHVKDIVSTVTHTEDFEVTSNFNPSNPTTTNNFKYDDIGNLNFDASECIDNITWNVYGKVAKIDRCSTSAKPDLEYIYDASGRRIMKIVKPSNSTTANTNWVYTVFTYDANGQLMGEYDINYQSTYQLKAKGRYIYGASKKGRTRDDIAITTTGVTSGAFVSVQACGTCAAATVVAPAAPSVSSFSRTLGNKQYEFSNHLGNVLVTISDRRMAVDDGTYTYVSTTLTKVNSTPDRKLDYYLPHVLTVTDYYPGGAPMPGRTLGTTTCSTTTTATVTTVRNDHFTGTTHSYTSINGATLTNTGGTTLTVTKSNGSTGAWGTRTPLTSLSANTLYTLSFTATYGACIANSNVGWLVVNSGGTVITSGLVASGSSTVTFSVPWNGNYHIEFYRTATLTGACSFVLDNVVLSYVSSYTQSTSCSTSTADGYPWGHNGQLKDNEIYGKGNAYSAEYWEYDARLIRRWNTDPVEYPWQSPYACFNNNPIYFADPAGLEGTNDTGGDKSCGCPDPPCAESKETKDPKGNLVVVGENAEVSEDRRLITYPNGTTGVYHDDLGVYVTPEKPKDGSVNVSGYRALDRAMYDLARREYSLRHPASVEIKYPEYKKGIGYQLFGELLSGRHLSEKENPYIWTHEENMAATNFMLGVLGGEMVGPVVGVVWASRAVYLARVTILSKGSKAIKYGKVLFQRFAAKGGIETANGLKITGFTEHGLNRAIGDFSRAGIKPNAILDALKNPLKINNVVTDQLGRQSQRFIGQFGEVVVNPQTGRIISVNPTSSSKAAKLLKQLGQ